MCPRQDLNLDLLLRREPFYPVELQGRAMHYSMSSKTYILKPHMPVNNFPPMTPQTDPRNDHLLELVEENNKMLKQMRRGQRLDRFLRILYWLVIIGIAVGSFYYLQPWIEQMMGIYSSVAESMGKAGEVGIPGFSLDDLMHLLPGGESAEVVATTTPPSAS